MKKEGNYKPKSTLAGGVDGRPFNPYWLCVLLPISFCLFAALILRLHEEQLQSTYIFLRNLGLEDALLKLKRPAFIYEYLFQHGNAKRWMAIIVFLSMVIPITIFGLLVVLIQGTRFLNWYAKTDARWVIPIPVGSYWTFPFVIAFCIIMALSPINDFLGLPSDPFRPSAFENSIHLNNWGFFDYAIDVFVIIFCFQGIHFIVYRFFYNLRISLNQRREP